MIFASPGPRCGLRRANLRKFRRFSALGGIAALTFSAAFSLAGCSLPDVSGATAAPPRDFDVDNLTFAVITHASAGDEFWDRVQSGVMQAGADYGVNGPAMYIGVMVLDICGHGVLFQYTGPNNISAYCGRRYLWPLIWPYLRQRY